MSAPLEARLLLAAERHMSPTARAELAAGHVGSRLVRAEFARISRTIPLEIALTRSEARHAVFALIHGPIKEIAA